jgi:hypothetical protein
MQAQLTSLYLSVIVEQTHLWPLSASVTEYIDSYQRLT